MVPGTGHKPDIAAAGIVRANHQHVFEVLHGDLLTLEICSRRVEVGQK